MAGDARKPDGASSPASAGAPTSEHRLTPAQVRRLRAVRALHARATSTDQAPARLVELVAQLWTEGAQVTDLADALAMAPDAVVTLLRTAGLPAA